MLQDHLHTHTNEPYKCEICSKQFRKKMFMLIHFKRIHLGQKSHKCDFCDKGFFDLRDKKLHLQDHTGEKPF